MSLNSTTLVIGCDHAAFELKEGLKAQLAGWGFTVEDVGCDSPESVDYPLIAQSVAQRLKDRPGVRGIILCGSGVGVMIAANRFDWIRAVHAHDGYLAQLSREHNDSNVLCMGARFVAPPLAQAIIRTWLDTAFEGHRHQRRVDQLTGLNG
jgi:ribose 5-phosphate isomerase B